ncbi:hypothetical protein CDD82_192 [Ophiocordyceps australis]|uniref:Uncharacterized protein n=1 Tax=Ophiocordyceps australis TaxID=1399860 RepID=A0A2C5YPS1_9HYPO|nr:hypothetical protein CDD82_192 [Ophiocordyceps australis]
MSSLLRHADWTDRPFHHHGSEGARQENKTLILAHVGPVQRSLCLKPQTLAISHSARLFLLMTRSIQHTALRLAIQLGLDKKLVFQLETNCLCSAVSLAADLYLVQRLWLAVVWLDSGRHVAPVSTPSACCSSQL